jgi:uncharacterized membrane protein YphA (DoxX/SURF4 family)
MRSSKLKNIGYWATTGLLGAGFVFGGTVDAVQAPPALAIIGHLGYPAYFASIIGVWKVLGGMAVLVPRLPRLKEWAYAGIIFDLTGAAASHLASGDGLKVAITPIVMIAVVIASWSQRPESRTLAAAAPDATEATGVAVRATATAR